MPEHELDLVPIKARCEAASAEPWHWDVDNEWIVDANNHRVFCGVDDYGDEVGSLECHHGDSEFAIHARTDVPALVEEVERLRERTCTRFCPARLTVSGHHGTSAAAFTESNKAAKVAGGNDG